MALICNDDCESMIASSTTETTSEKTDKVSFPKGIPVSFRYDGEKISLHDCKCEEEVTGEENNQKIFRRCVLENGIAVEMKASFYDEQVIDYILYFERM